MRYAQGGGLTDAGRAARERIRLKAVERFEGGEKNREIAGALRVSERSVERWRRQWRDRREAGVLGPPARQSLIGGCLPGREAAGRSRGIRPGSPLLRGAGSVGPSAASAHPE
ncbi:helix-turn-helix domain-containing protein [Streptomyces vinaceus]|uniref:helix-turn-helix domain-containing protein n=1 Tax=Streptomyces vinaceus TaxID=1960 RepID=UPI00381A76B8